MKRRDRNEIYHKCRCRVIQELDEVLVYNPYHLQPEKEKLKIVVLNAERGRYLDEIVAYLNFHPALKDSDIIFFNELDYGMARSGNLNTAGELSRRLKMNYIFGAEFLELTKGDKKERRALGKNREALHGNAIMSRYVLEDPFLLRLPLDYDWYYDYQKRIGTRIALFTRIKVGKNELGLVCTHLENNTSQEGRASQMKNILEEVEKRFAHIPSVIAGDMNTNTFDGKNATNLINTYYSVNEKDRETHPEKYEPLFKLIENHRFDYKSANLPGKRTFKKQKLGLGTFSFNLDWIFTKELECHSPVVVESIFKRSELPGFYNLQKSEGLEFSDHSAISVEVRFINCL